MTIKENKKSDIIMMELSVRHCHHNYIKINNGSTGYDYWVEFRCTTCDHTIIQWT